FRFAHDTTPIRRLLTLSAVVSLVGAPFTVLMPIFADKVLHTGPQGLGMLMSTVGVGSLVGSLLLASRRGLSGLGRWIVRSAAGLGAALVLFAFSRSLALSLLVLGIAGFCLFYQATASNTLIQAMSPEVMRGRAIGILSMLILGVAPFGALAAGARGGGAAAGLWRGGVRRAAGGGRGGPGVRAREPRLLVRHAPADRPGKTVDRRELHAGRRPQVSLEGREDDDFRGGESPRERDANGRGHRERRRPGPAGDRRGSSA